MNRTIRLEELNISPVDPHSPIPLYHQVYVDLLGIIRSEQIKPGDMLPPEMQLCEAYGVGRQTIRGALLRLVDDHYLERYAGRGTFVRETQDRQKFYLDRSFAQQMHELGLTPSSKVLEKASGVIKPSSPQALQGKLDSPCLNLVRLRYGDELPIGVQYTTIVTSLCPDLERFDFNKESLYNVLSTHYQLPITRIDQNIRAVIADDVHRNLLQTYIGAPLLYVDTTAYLDNGEPIEATTSYYRADHYEFSVSEAYAQKP